MKKLIIVLFISALLLSMPCATAASLSDLDSDDVDKILLELDDDNSQPMVGIKIFIKDPEVYKRLIELIFKIKRK